MIHLYYNSSTSTQAQQVTDAFEHCKLVDISKLKTLEEASVYFVEIDKAEKNILLHVRKLLTGKKNSLIYFFINDSHSLMLFQLASLLNVKSIITPKNEISKIISNIKRDIKIDKEMKLELSMAKAMKDDISFIIFDSNKLLYASPKLYKEFDYDSLEDIESNLFTKFDLEHFLENDTTQQESFALIRSNSSQISNKKFIYLDSLPKNAPSASREIEFVKNRIFFIETLKDKILEKSISESHLGIITLQIENMTNLRKDWSEYEIEMAVRDVLFQVALEVDSESFLAQYDDYLYLSLFYNLKFDELKEKASKIQDKITNFTSKQKIKPIVGLYAFDIADSELNDTLNTISDISKEMISSKDVKTKNLFRVTNMADNLDDGRVIDMYLQTAFTNKTPIKLLNIFKGLCINTSSMVIKKTEEDVHITFEQLQGTAISFEKTTIIQSSNFSKDILADVVHIDYKKKIAHLKNFRFISGSANGRKYSRVTCSQRTPISLTHDKGTINGEILDISMNSIALKTRVYSNMDSLKLSKIVLNFTLPVAHNELGYMKLSLEGKVMFNICGEKHCKIIVNLFNDQSNESVLMEYVYGRQKEIIVELKKQSTMLS